MFLFYFFSFQNVCCAIIIHLLEYNTTGTEDHHSSFSETAWDNYQEKYNSENYSEGFDSDAARKLLEFGDDYRYEIFKIFFLFLLFLLIFN